MQHNLSVWILQNKKGDVLNEEDEFIIGNCNAYDKFYVAGRSFSSNS